MPFKSEKQRKWMHANKPKMAKKWEKEEEPVNEGTANVYGVDFLKNMKDKKFHKSSLEMVSHQGRKMHKKMTLAIMKKAEKLRKEI